MFAAHPIAHRAMVRHTRLSLFRTLCTSPPKQCLLRARELTQPIPAVTQLHSTRNRQFMRPYSASTTPASSPSAPPDLSHLDPAELNIHTILTAKLTPTELEVRDVSGGCGSMYAINVTSEAFRGLSVIKQHRLVNEALKAEMKGWHGCQVRTRVP